MWIVIEVFGTPTIVTNENGEVLYFTTEEEAQEEANQCQDGRILEIQNVHITIPQVIASNF